MIAGSKENTLRFPGINKEGVWGVKKSIFSLKTDSDLKASPPCAAEHLKIGTINSLHSTV